MPKPSANAKRGGFRRPPLECRCLVRSYAPAGCRRATHVDLEGPAPAPCRHLCSRRRPPQRRPSPSPRRRCRSRLQTRRGAASADPLDLCLPCAPLPRASQLPSRRLTQTSRVQLPLSTSLPTALPADEAVCTPIPRHLPYLPWRAAACRRATPLEGAASALRRHLCSRRRPPIGARRPRPAADAEAVCKREEGRLPPPLLNAATLCALAH